MHSLAHSKPQSAEDIVMTEQRKHERQLTLKTGNIHVAPAGHERDCAIVDISEGGACVLVENEVDIPDAFDLTFHHDGLTRACKVVWRNGHKIGVSFDGAPSFAWQAR